MRRFVVLLALLSAAPAAALEVCDELWFTRNLIYDRAGYCFTSTLGQAVFDNTGCIGTDVEPDPALVETLASVRDLEREWECSIDTSRRALAIPDLAARMRILDIPVPDGYDSACIGWRGVEIALHTARDPGSPVTGVIRTGETIQWSFWPVDGWSFVQSPSGNGMGWMIDPKMTEASCDSFAG